jgi:hypothetical protein
MQQRLLVVAMVLQVYIEYNTSNTVGHNTLPKPFAFYVNAFSWRSCGFVPVV